jgi:hypothetical protein
MMIHHDIFCTLVLKQRPSAGAASQNSTETITRAGSSPAGRWPRRHQHLPPAAQDNMIACFVGWEAQFDGIEDSIGFDKNYLARAVSADSIGAWLQICRFHSYVASVHNSTVFLVYVESTARPSAILTPLIHTG